MRENRKQERVDPVVSSKERTSRKQILDSNVRNSRLPRHAPWRWATRKTTARSFNLDIPAEKRVPLKENKAISNATVIKSTSVKTISSVLPIAPKSSIQNASDLKKKKPLRKETPVFESQRKTRHVSSSAGSKIPVYNLKRRRPLNTSKGPSDKQSCFQQKISRHFTPSESFGLSPIPSVSNKPLLESKGRTCSTPIAPSTKKSKAINKTYVYKPQKKSTEIKGLHNFSVQNTIRHSPRIKEKLESAVLRKDSKEDAYNKDGETQSQIRQESLKTSSRKRPLSTSPKTFTHNRSNKSTKLTPKRRRSKLSRQLSFDVEDTYVINNQANNTSEVSRTKQGSPKRLLSFSTVISQEKVISQTFQKNTSSDSKRNACPVPVNDNVNKVTTAAVSKSELLPSGKQDDRVCTKTEIFQGKQMFINFYFAPDEGGKETVFENKRTKRTALGDISKQNKKPKEENNIKPEKVAFWRGIGTKRNVCDLTDLDIIFSSVKDVFQCLRVSKESWRNDVVVQKYSTLLEDYLFERIEEIAICQVLKKKVNKMAKELENTSNRLGILLDKKFELQEEEQMLQNKIEEKQYENRNQGVSWKSLQKLVTRQK